MAAVTAWPAGAARWLGLGRRDRRCIFVLLAVPILVFVVPALCGHAVVNSDNQIQNLPLRALAGEDLRHGHLPLWNPYIWSGSPLLGGLNAGALYPFTWLFAFLPVLAAWTVNLVVVYVTAAVGMYALLRQQQLRPFAACLGAASFAFAGSMSAQVVHIGIVQGVSWIPWMLLVEQRLAHQILGRRADAEAEAARSVWRRVTVLGLLGGLVLLTGEPRGMADAAVVIGLAAGWHLVTSGPSWRARAAFLASFVLSTALAAALGAVQLIPGWSFISDSQRAQSTVTFFGSGSLPVRWSVLMLVPDLLGGTGVLNQPVFFSHYNLPEITGYVGLVPLMAVGGLLARSFGGRRHRRSRRWTPWFGLVVVGMVLTYGEYTPLGPLLAHLPFDGDLRLQSRNIVIADLALCVLVAYWLDLVVDTSPGRVAPGTVERRTVRLATAAPAAAAAVVCLVALSWPAPLEEWLGVDADLAHLGRTMAPWFVATLVVALAAVVVGVGLGRLGMRTRAVTLGALVTADLVLFTVTSVAGLDVSFPAPQLPTPASAVPVVTGTRFAIFDPANEYEAQFSSLAQNDLNDLVHLPSVEGYGSLTDSGYQGATGTRTHDTLSPCALAEGYFVPLDLGTVLTVSDDLIEQTGVPAATLTAIPESACPVSRPPGNVVWWFGRQLSIVGASVAFGGRPAAPGAVRVGLVSESGGTRWTPATVTSAGGALTIHFATPVVGSGLVLTGRGTRSATDATSVTTADGRRYRMDGLLQSALREASFRLTGYRDGVAVFRTAVRSGPLSLEPTGAGTATTASPGTTVGTVHRVDTTPWGQETDTVTVRRPADLVRSEAFSVGWRADVHDTVTGRSLTLPVARIGLVEKVHLPPGRYTVTWVYDPASVTAGLLVTAAGTLVVAVAGVSWLYRRRRRHRHRHRWPGDRREPVARELSPAARRRAGSASSGSATGG